MATKRQTDPPIYKRVSPPVTINPEEIPNLELKLLCSTLLESVQKFFADPKNLAAFEAWSRSRQEEQSV